MARKVYTLTKTCVHPGCNETILHSYSSRRDMAESRVEEWRCIYHSGRANITPDNPLWSQRRHLRVVPRWNYSNYVKGLLNLDSPDDKPDSFLSGEDWIVGASFLPLGAKVIIEENITVIMPKKEEAMPSWVSSIPKALHGRINYNPSFELPVERDGESFSYYFYKHASESVFAHKLIEGRGVWRGLTADDHDYIRGYLIQVKRGRQYDYGKGLCTILDRPEKGSYLVHTLGLDGIERSIPLWELQERGNDNRD